MRIGVLGTGAVGTAIASKLVALGHEVRMGSRTDGNEKAVAWVERAGAGASEGDFAAAAAYGDVVFNCTSGEHTLAVIAAAGADNLGGKLLVDVTNPLVAGNDGPELSVCNTDSLGEQVQRAVPEAKVVKTLNTVNCDVMVDASLVPGDHVIFVSGDDAEAKAQATDLLAGFGWPAERVYDLGDITTARGPEMYLALWIRLRMTRDDNRFNIAITG
jgi:8-hydroxy-5-deazaflavin:NADPH oxidoreductase